LPAAVVGWFGISLHRLLFGKYRMGGHAGTLGQLCYAGYPNVAVKRNSPGDASTVRGGKSRSTSLLEGA
jgi:hypothetical protein